MLFHDKAIIVMSKINRAKREIAAAIREDRRDTKSMLEAQQTLRDAEDRADEICHAMTALCG